MGPTSGYKFITFGTDDGGFQPADKSIRSHAIRTAIREGPSTLGANTALTSRDTIKLKAQLKGRFRIPGTTPRRAPTGKHARSQIQEEEAPPLWVQRLGSDSADPFHTLPIPTSQSVDSLVKYCEMRPLYEVENWRVLILRPSHHEVQSQLDHDRHTEPWFPYAMQSALIMRVTLALAAEFLTATMPLCDSKLQLEGYRQKGEAMRIIRSRLESRESAQSASDDLSVLAGVAMLGSVEAFQGHFAAAETHLTGLHYLITARGGPETIRHDYILCRCINWIDIQVASGLGQVPKFAMFHTIDQVSLPSSVVSRAMTPSLRHLDSLGGHNPNESNDPRKIFRTLRQAICSQAGAVSADSIRIVMNTADSSILHFLYVERRSATPVQKRFLVLVSAAQVFLYAALREIPTTGHMIRTLVARMRAALEDADSIPLIWVSHDAAIVWVLFVGIVGSGTAEDRQWFSSRLGKVLERARDMLPAHSCRRDKLQQLLAGFLWQDKYCQPVLDDVWGSWEQRGVTKSRD